MIPLSVLFEEAKPVITVKKVEVSKDWICPHCGNQILEKSLYSPDDGKTMTHRECGGEIILPSEDNL